MIIKFENYNKSLGTRKLGELIRNEVEQCLHENHEMILDFRGIDVISSSFADEFFGKLVNKHGIEFIKTITRFKNTNKFIKMVIIDTLKLHNKQ